MKINGTPLRTRRLPPRHPELENGERSSMVVSRYHQSGYTHDLLHAQKSASCLVIVGVGWTSF